MSDETRRRSQLGRRDTLRLACALGATAVCGGCGQGAVDAPTGPVAAGNVKDLTMGALIVTNYVAVGRDAGGVYAMSAVCTHAGCPTQPSDGGDLYCDCHGSLFDHNGGVLRGPARAPLQHYKVDIAADGSITVQAGMPVSADARTPLG
jgi:Rieske Fe-S protein